VRLLSAGDEVGCGGTPNNKTSLAIYFKQWAEERRGLTLAELGCSDHVASPTNWSGCFNDSASLVSPGAASRRYFYSQLFSHDYGIETYATITAIAREYVPQLHTAANYPPGNAMQGPSHQWIRAFREKAFTNVWAVRPHDPDSFLRRAASNRNARLASRSISSTPDQISIEIRSQISCRSQISIDLI